MQYVTLLPDVLLYIVSLFEVSLSEVPGVSSPMVLLPKVSSSEVSLSEVPSSEVPSSEVPIPIFPLRPAIAHNTIAVSFTEFFQHPFVSCENNNQSRALDICSADELPSAIRDKDVS